jgi:hypothetical protein
MATMNMFTDLIKPLGEWLQSCPELEGIKIFYDRTRDRMVARDSIPAINYFWMGPTNDTARGSGSASLQVRRKRITIGFGVWAASNDENTLDEVLWEMVGVLEDLLRSKTDFDPRKGISLQDAITNDADYDNSGGPLIGTVLVTAEFELFGGRFAGTVGL